MSKIEEMAAEYSDKILAESKGKKNSDWNTYSDGYEDAISNHVEEAYIQGAKTVLEEIEKAYNTFKDTGATCAMIKKVLKELKG